MIEILSRYTSQVLYSSASATVIAEAVAEARGKGADLGGADLRSANLRGADLGGADLGGADGILRISGGRHDVVASGTGVVSIGCHTYPIARWLKSYKAVGKNEGYSDGDISDYADRLKLAAIWIKRQKPATKSKKVRK